MYIETLDMTYKINRGKRKKGRRRDINKEKRERERDVET
jgi:hypothetical protein